MPTNPNPVTATSISRGSTKIVTAGQTVTFSLNLSTTIEVTGNPRLTLSNGKFATYVQPAAGNAGVGTVASFTYTVSAGDDTSDLVVTGLDLNGGTLGTAPGLFTIGAMYKVPSVGSVTILDVNGDGRADLVFGTQGSGVSVLLGDGRGGFLGAMSYAVGNPVGRFAVADFNHDGRPDLAFATADGVNVALNDGSGGFGYGGTYFSGLSVSGVAAADFDGDGQPDLAVSTTYGGSSGGQLFLLPGDGNGVFRTPIATGLASNGLVVGDFNGDGRPDLVTNSSRTTMSVLLNTGAGFAVAGTYTPPDAYRGGLTLDGTFNVVDLDGDGRLDIIAQWNFYSSLIPYVGQYEYVGAGDGSFSPTTGKNITAGSQVQIADLNGDGHLDLVQASVSSLAYSQVGVQLADGSGGYKQGYYYASNTVGALISLGLADLNADGLPDIVAYNVGAYDENRNIANFVEVLLNTTMITNVSSASVAAAPGADTHIVVDTVAPVVTVMLVSDTGASSTDHVTSNPALTGTGEAGGTITVRSGSTALGTATVGPDGRWSLTPALADGSYTLTVTEPDAAGNIGTATISLTLARKAQTVGIALASDTGSSATDRVTRDATLAGTADAGSTVTVLNGSTVLGTTVASAAGSWTFVPALTDGSYNLTAQQTDLAGNTGGSAPLSFTLDTVPPVVTARVTNETGAASSGVAADPVLAGTAEAGGTVQVLDGSTVVGTATVGADGQWSATPSLSAGQHTLTVAEADLAGNVGRTTVSVTQTQYHGPTDILWRGAGGEVDVWGLNGTAITSGGHVAYLDPNHWTASGFADATGDGRADILWRGTSGEVDLWGMTGATVTSGGHIANLDPTHWKAVGFADATGDGKADILWRGTSGELDLWGLDGTAVTSGGHIVTLDPGYWTAVGFADATGDGKADVLWRGANGEVDLWALNGTAVTSAGRIATLDPSYWTVAGFADATGDGKADILWRGRGGEVDIWNLDGTTVTGGGHIATLDPAYWSVASFANKTGDGRADILWRGAGGEVDVWGLNGTSITSGGHVTNVDAGYWHAAA